MRYIMIPSKKQFVLIAILMLGIVSSYTQNWEYSQHIKVDTKSEVRGVTLDSDTNLYITAFHRTKTSGTELVGPHGSKVYPTLYPASAYGKQDILVIKLQQDGDTLWTRRIHSGDSDYPRQIELDNNDNPYVTGIFKSDLNFPGITVVPEIPYPTSSNDIFLAQYGSDGSGIFARTVAWGPDDDRVNKITVDDHNNIYMTGTYTDTLFFDGDTLLQSTSSDYSLFLAKFQSNGDFIWAKELPVLSATSTPGNLLDIEISNDAEIYLSGYFNDTLIYDTDSVFANGTDNDILLVKIDSAGALQWMRTAGSPNADDRANGLTTDPTGAVYITGYFNGTATFDGQDVISAGGTDMFLAKYNKTGNLIWVSRNGDAGTDIAYGARVRENLLQTTGAFSGIVTFNQTTVSTNGTTEQNPGFFVYDIYGNPVTAQSLPTNNAPGTNSRAEYIEYDLSGDTYIGGYFGSGELYVGSDTLTRLASSNGAFVAKYINPFSATVTAHADISCPGETDGLIQVTSYFGTAPYTYEWNHDAMLNSYEATNLDAGNYSVKITDALGDTIVVYDTVQAPDTIKISLAATPATCHLANDGSIATTVTQGSAPYSFAWSGAAGLDPVAEDQSGLSPGWCYVTVNDNAGCSAKDSVEITEPQKITSTSVVGEDTGPSDGTIDLTVQGGTSPYAYTWEYEGSPIAGTTPNLLGLAEGLYTAYVTDDNSCTYDTNIFVPGITLRVLLSGNDVSCYGADDGSLIASISSGYEALETYTFEFQDSAKNTLYNGPDSTLESLAPGWYYVVLTEVGTAETATDSILLVEPDSISLNLTANSLTCYGDNNGFVSLSVSGGNMPYAYLWSSGQTTESISSVPAGWYTVTVTDNNGCIAQDSAEVTQNDSLEVDISVAQVISCNGNADGILQSNVSGGVSPYNYAWDDPGSQTESFATDLSTGMYSVTVTDDVGCIGQANILLNEPDVLAIANVDSSDVTCLNAADGRIAVTMVGGTQDYSYAWSPALSDTNVVENLLPFTYSLTVTDANGCIDNSLSVEIERPATALSVSEDAASHVDNLCNGESLGELAIIATGGWNGYQYSINGIDYQASNSFTGLGAQDYEVFVRDANSCEESMFIEITSPLAINVSAQGIGNTIIVTASGGTSPLSYIINGDGTPQASNRFDNLSDGTYFVDVTDANVCGPIRSNEIVISGSSIDQTFMAIANVYPNPSDGIFNLQVDPISNGEYTIEVISVNGARVYNKVHFAEAGVNKNIEIDLSNNAKGIYLIKVNGITLKNKLVIE